MKVRLLVALVVLSSYQLALAKDPSALASPDIPSVSEVLKDWTPLPKMNPYQPFSQYFNSDLADTIAAFEQHFPGLRYAPLGRDAMALGWLIDSFYCQVGQPDRVIYLRGSGTTIRGKGARLVDFIESAGFSLDPKKMKTQAPMVLLDRTSQESGQLAQIIKVAHQEYVRRGGRAGDIVRKLAAFSFDRDSITYFYDKIIENPKFKVEGEEPLYLASEKIFPEFSKYDKELYQWHDGYGPLRQQKDGKWYGAPGKLSPLAIRKQLLGTLYELLQNTGSSFLALVQQHAKERGYTFPVLPTFSCSSAIGKVKAQ